MDSDTAELTDGPAIERSSHGWRVLASLSVLLVASAVAFARIGFNPTDDGFVLAQSARILHGASPHGGLVSPRPLGSPLLHTVDILLPTPLLITSRVIALLEFLVIAAILVRLVRGRAFREWGLTEVALTALAFLVNLHRFPLLSWHTTDGLLVTALALLAVEIAFDKDAVLLLGGGALLAGFAPVIKQSFACTPLLILAWVGWRLYRARGKGKYLRPLRAWLVVLAVGAVPGLVYLGWVGATSSIGNMADQLLTPSGVEPFAAVSLNLLLIAILDIIAAVALAVYVQRRRSGASSGKLGSLSDLTKVGMVLIGVGLPLSAAWILHRGHLDFTGNWGTYLWWFALGSSALWCATRSQLDMPTIAILTMAWMASLSWGYPSTNLMAGSLLVVVILRSAGSIEPLVPQDRIDLVRVVGISLLMVLLLATAIGSVDARRSEVYRDHPANDQPADLGRIAPSMWGIRSNNTTEAYLTEIRDCLAKYPSQHLAVVPDSAVVPLLLGRSNPMPLDWWYDKEIPQNRGRVLRQVDQLSERGDYLVLFQTVAAQDLWWTGYLEPATKSTPIFDYSDGMGKEVFDHLAGERVVCGSFKGIYRPANR